MLSMLIKALVTLFVVLPIKVFVVLPAKLLGFAGKFLGAGIKAVVWLILLPIRLLLLPFKILF